MNWIPCSQQMPDDGEAVMTFSPMSSDPVWPGFLDGGFWTDLSGLLFQFPVTHWMPFPEPPEVTP